MNGGVTNRSELVVMRDGYVVAVVELVTVAVEGNNGGVMGSKMNDGVS